MRFAQALGSGLLGALMAIVTGGLVTMFGYWLARCDPIFRSCDSGWRATAGNVVMFVGVALLIVIAPLLLIGMTIYPQAAHLAR